MQCGWGHFNLKRNKWFDGGLAAIRKSRSSRLLILTTNFSCKNESTIQQTPRDPLLKFYSIDRVYCLPLLSLPSFCFHILFVPLGLSGDTTKPCGYCLLLCWHSSIHHHYWRKRAEVFLMIAWRKIEIHSRFPDAGFLHCLPSFIRPTLANCLVVSSFPKICCIFVLTHHSHFLHTFEEGCVKSII